MISGAKILVTGATGSVGGSLARYLTPHNEVWGAARFTDPARRQAQEEAGIKTVRIDVGSGDFCALPQDFDYVIHASWMRAGLDQLQEAIRNNIEGVGLLMQHTCRAKATMVVSGMPVYTPNPDPAHLFAESDPVGASSYAFAPTSPYSKAGVEAVARFCARAFDMKVVITRLNSVMGTPRSYPEGVIRSVLGGHPIMAPHERNMQSPIHIADMQWQLEPLLAAASNPAFIVNWGGDEHMAVQDWVKATNEWSGKSATVQVHSVPGAPVANAADPTLRQSVTGPSRIDFWAEFRAIYDRVAAEDDPGAGDFSGMAVRKTS
ncbi:NAD-dependent epimerase/dehydratase family protein [Novosphingobium bradum]|uniref:NAD-dependent epimerase/dehydratase family protein n=1 Tax=Novosphingobium bradum TaxID=1737444 RepID=A0ABV7INK0_9SPHN